MKQHQGYRMNQCIKHTVAVDFNSMWKWCENVPEANKCWTVSYSFGRDDRYPFRQL